MIEINSAGLLTTVQDLGRNGFQRFGVPVAGAMDAFAHSLANILVGNPRDAATLEATILGPAITFLEPCVFALCGGDFAPVLDGAPIVRNRAYRGEKGSVLQLGAAKMGCRVYIAFSGGIHVPLVMGSRSTYWKGNFGGLEGRPLKKGDSLEILPGDSLPDTAGTFISQDFGIHYSSFPMVRVVMGPQDDQFSVSGKTSFFSGEYTVTAENDRMGYRLSGPQISFAEGFDGNIISDGLSMGAVQISKNQPILMMADRQTTGGYAKLASVITADLPLVSQLKEGDHLRFRSVAIEEAQSLYLAQKALLDNLEIHLAKGGRGEVKSVSIRINDRPQNALVSEI